MSFFTFYSCASNQTEEKPSKPAVKVQTTEVEDVEDSDDVVLLDDDEDDEEYLRSTNGLSSEETVTKKEFEEDKAEILRIIAELEKIMAKADYDAWQLYIAPESINYYSSAANIRKVQKRLPDKTVQLHGLKDYFKKVYIPTRQKTSVEEIRYISKNNIRGGYYKGDTFVITYYFVKIDGKWFVHIPPVD